MQRVDGWVSSLCDFGQDGVGAARDVHVQQTLDHDSFVLVRAYATPRAVSASLSFLPHVFLVLVLLSRDLGWACAGVIAEACGQGREVSAQCSEEVDVCCKGKTGDEQIDFPVSDLQG